MLSIQPKFSFQSFSKQQSPINRNKTEVSSTQVSFKGYKPDAVNKVAIKEIVKLVQSAKVKKIAIFAHVFPDGDAIGSMLAMKRIIKQSTGKNSDVFTLYPIATKFNFLDAGNEITSVKKVFKEEGIILNAPSIRQKYGDYDLAIALDTAEKKLFDKDLYDSLIVNAKKVVKIDHHPVDKTKLKEFNYAGINFVDKTKESASQIVMQFVKPFGIKLKKVGADISDPISAGLISDSGQFKYARGEAIFKDARELSKTTNFKELIFALDRIEHDRFSIYAQILNNLKLSEDGKIAYFVVDKADAKLLHISESAKYALAEVSKISGVDYCFSIIKNSADVEAGVFSSIRSSGKPIRNAMREIGGNGHEQACGIKTTEKTPEELIELILSKLYELEASPKK